MTSPLILNNNFYRILNCELNSIISFSEVRKSKPTWGWESGFGMCMCRAQSRDICALCCESAQEESFPLGRNTMAGGQPSVLGNGWTEAQKRMGNGSRGEVLETMTMNTHNNDKTNGKTSDTVIFGCKCARRRVRGWEWCCQEEGVGYLYLLWALPFSLGQCCQAFHGNIRILLFKHNLKQVSYKWPVIDGEAGGRPGVLLTWLSLPPRTEYAENLWGLRVSQGSLARGTLCNMQLNWVEMTVSQSNLESYKHGAVVWGQRQGMSVVERVMVWATEERVR